MSYPREYPTSDGTALAPEDWNAALSILAGFTPEGVFKSSYTFVIVTENIEGTDYYYACNAYQIVYGGPDDVGGKDGTDAKVVIQAALDASAGGGIIFIGEGTFTLSSNLLFSPTHNDITLCGSGKGTVLQSSESLPAEQDAYVIRIRGTSVDIRTKRVTIENLKVVGAEANHHPIHVYWSDECVIRNVWVVDGEEGICILKSNRNEVSDCYIEDTGTAGVEVVSDSHYNIVRNNIFKNCNTDTGIETSGSLRIWHGDDTKICKYNVLEGNIIIDSNYYGYQGLGGHYTTIANNVIINPAETGMYWVDTGCSVTGNIIDMGGNDSAIQCNGAATIMGNYIYNVEGTTQYGIEVREDGIIVVGNNIDTAFIGIYVASKDYAVIKGNVMTNIADDDGIRLTAATYCTVIGNILAGKRIGTYTTSDYNTLTENCVSTMLLAGTNNIVRDNRGYITENKGSDSIANGTTSKVVAHGLDVTPVAEDFTIIGKENPTNDVGTIWVDTIGAANFTVNVEADPGASNWDFGWKVIVL